MPKKTTKLAAVAAPAQPLRLDLGAGPNKREGFTGVDILPFDGRVDVVLDLRQSWPWANESVEEAHSSHFIEHLRADERIHFFNELHRVLKPKAQCQIVTPHWGSGRAYGDLTHQWPPVVEMFWFYLNKDWRAQNAPHVPLTCDFDAGWGHSVSPEWAARNDATRNFAINHYREVAQDMICTLTKK
jgi:SAM-dependent methyltransferase